jgi:hypothetical protein
MYPGGDVSFHERDLTESGGDKLTPLFLEYLAKRSITRHPSISSVYTMAQELSLELNERYTFLLLDPVARIAFLMQRIKYQMEILTREEKSKDVFHLN